MKTEQYIKFFHFSREGETGEFDYRLSKSAEIEIRKVSDNLTILKMIFRRLVPLADPIEEYEGSTELMLTNYPITFNTLSELDNKTIEIKDGWTKEVSFTMLSINDGEPTNDNIIKFRQHTDDSLWVKWTGTYTDYLTRKGSRFELRMVVSETDKITTALCSYNDELEALFEKTSLEDLTPME